MLECMGVLGYALPLLILLLGIQRFCEKLVTSERAVTISAIYAP